MRSYPLYFQALIARDEAILKKSFPSFFYADTSQAIKDAQRNGWVMRPPGSVVVLGVQSQSNGTVRVRTCRSQTTQYWDPKAKAWTVPAPKGSPQVIDMIKTGVGWMPYKLASSKGVTLRTGELSGLDQNWILHCSEKVTRQRATGMMLLVEDNLRSDESGE